MRHNIAYRDGRLIKFRRHNFHDKITIGNNSYRDTHTISNIDYYDVTIEGLSKLPDTIEIGLPFNPDDLDTSIPLEENFDPAYWNEEKQMWIDHFYRVDPETNMVYVATDHLSVSITGLGSAAAVIGILGEVGERLLNDKYILIQRGKKNYFLLKAV